MKNYINEIFFVRAIACLSVVLLHNLNYAIEGYREMLPNSTVVIASGFAMLFYFGTPAFVLISEILVANSYKERIPKNFLSKRFKLILIPYILMGTLYALPEINAAGGELSVSTFLSTAFQNVVLGEWHGYFVIIIFQFYILHMLLYKKLKVWKPSWVLIVSFLVNAIYLTFFRITEPTNIPIATYIWDRGHWLLFLGWVFYFFIAYYIGVNYQKFKEKISRYKLLIFSAFSVSTVVVMAFTLLDVFYRTSKRPDMILYTCTLVFLIFIGAIYLKRVPKLIGLVSQYSYGIYLLHMFFLIAVFKPTSSIPFPLYVTLTFLGSLVFSMLLIYLLNQIPIGKYVVGKIGVKPKNSQ